MTEKLGEKISEIRKRSGLGSQKKAAALLGVGLNTLWHYENEKTLPDVGFLARLASISGADFDELLRLRLEASGDDTGVLEIRDGPASYGSGLDRELRRDRPSLGSADAAAQVRAELRQADIPVEWALLLMQLVTSGDLRAEGARAIIEFLTAEKRCEGGETKNN